jgi:hypothetical protein
MWDSNRCALNAIRPEAEAQVATVLHILVVCTNVTRDNPSMNISIPITLAIFLTPAAVESSELVLTTAFGGVFCATPFQLRKAIIAARNDEGARIRQLECLRAGSRIKAIWLDQIGPPYGPWQVRLLPTHAPPITVWGYASSFETSSEQIDSR